MDFLRAYVFSPSYDPLGFLSLTLADDIGFLNVGRRVNVIPTLDGGVVVDDGGATDKDRTFSLASRLKSRLDAEQIKYMTLNHPQLNVSLRDGCFRTVPLSVEFSDISCTWTLRVIERLA